MYFFFSPGMAPSPEFGMEKINQSQKLTNKVDGTPKTESKKVKCLYLNGQFTPK